MGLCCGTHKNLCMMHTSFPSFELEIKRRNAFCQRKENKILRQKYKLYTFWIMWKGWTTSIWPNNFMFLLFDIFFLHCILYLYCMDEQRRIRVVWGHGRDQGQDKYKTLSTLLAKHETQKSHLMIRKGELTSVAQQDKHLCAEQSFHKNKNKIQNTHFKGWAFRTKIVSNPPSFIMCSIIEPPSGLGPESSMVSACFPDPCLFMCPHQKYPGYAPEHR